MTDIKTASGFEAIVNEKAADDIEFIELAYRTADNDVLAYRDIAKLLLGADGYDKLLNHIETEDGRHPISALVAEITDITNEITSVKK